METVKEAKRIVIKVGTSTLTYANGKPNLRKIEKLAMVLSDIQNSGRQVVLVSSGAISIGVNRLGLEERPKDTPGKQAAAAVGQCDLMSIYDRAFAEYGYVTAQILLNRDITDHENLKTNVVNTFNALLDMRAIPIVNENDSVAVEEILFGDNDNLSAIVASLIGAELLIILTDIDGYYDDNPVENPDAHMLARVEKITEEMIQAAGGSGTARGTGGMRTKLEAAAYAAQNGIATVVMSGERVQKIYDLLDGHTVGTYFAPKTENNKC
ncbi:MAG: glutamate 5-kinase [Clostridia bacterium]|nr:glutamate 5-kinase [Clostridia bacterium]